MSVKLRSIIQCPHCGFKATETMPGDQSVDLPVFLYACEACKQSLRPVLGEACVFCRYGSVPCPPVQLGENCCERGQIKE